MYPLRPIFSLLGIQGGLSSISVRLFIKTIIPMYQSIDRVSVPVQSSSYTVFPVNFC